MLSQEKPLLETQLMLVPFLMATLSSQVFPYPGGCWAPGPLCLCGCPDAARARAVDWGRGELQTLCNLLVWAEPLCLVQSESAHADGHQPGRGCEWTTSVSLAWVFVRVFLSWSQNGWNHFQLSVATALGSRGSHICASPLPQQKGTLGEALQGGQSYRHMAPGRCPGPGAPSAAQQPKGFSSCCCFSFSFFLKVFAKCRKM